MGADIKLILTDIDGTILPYGQATVSPAVCEAFHAALDAGIIVGPASGRFYDWIPGFFSGDAACCATALAANGMQVYHKGEKILEKDIDPEALHKAAAIVRETPAAGLIYFEGATPYLVEGSREDLAASFPRYAVECLDSDGIPDVPLPKANVFINGSLEDTRALVARLNVEVGGVDFDVPQPMFSNVVPSGWNKGAAFAWLCDYLGVSRSEAVVFGDAGNDVPLFEVAEHSVAVAGASDEARAAARWHIGRVEDDAVAGAIAELAAGRWPFVA